MWFNGSFFTVDNDIEVRGKTIHGADKHLEFPPTVGSTEGVEVTFNSGKTFEFGRRLFFGTRPTDKNGGISPAGKRAGRADFVILEGFPEKDS